MVALTTSCSASETGKPERTGAADQPGTAQEKPLTAEAALGDLSAVDFCELLDAQALAKAGADVDFTVPSFRHCYVGVTTPSTTLTMTIGNLYDNNPKVIWPSEDEKLSRSVRRQSIEVEGEGCLRALMFADEIGLRVLAQPLSDAEQIDQEELCRIADAATDGVAEAAFSEETFPQSFRPGSLAELDPCEPFERAGVPDLFEDGVNVHEQLDGHGCALGKPSMPAVELDFEVSLTDLSDFSTKIAGRPTKVTPLEYGCEVTTPHIRFSEENPHEREVVTLSAVSFDPDRCAGAEELAALVWPELPEYRA
ncbi:hypothetical protein [Saccharomonospora cyanea]|uniref:hypothetical protein n=1 Tax=Saccharomonospora cyanea TaxID=40989 RepID=UPI001E2EF6FB|nr:hypothetical protein [Saccharomonospora cyanea]